jgi:hypothetical protein
MAPFGKIMVGIGILLVVVGLIVWLAGDRFAWFGRLPGDIRIQGENFGCFFPLTSMIIVSIVLSILLSILARFLNR